jgi:hypothetical protein
VQTLRHVLWIGGPPGAGKSSVATRLARRYGLRWYNADTRTWQHRDRALRTGNAAACRWEAMTPEQRWVGSTPRQMLEGSLHVERGPMVIDDLRACPIRPWWSRRDRRSRLARCRRGSRSDPGPCG